jgi:hypothetical protein
MSSKLLVLPLALATAFAAWPATAQLPRNPVSAAAQPAAPGVPSFRDPKTGQVWTPNNVGGYTGPETSPQDRAFNPNAQTAPMAGQILQQNAQVQVVGQVPITAGPTVPLVTIDSPTLSVPGARWQVVIYLQNNSASTFAPTLDCRFTNAGSLVLDSNVQAGPVAGGNRVGLFFFGPPSSIYVDNVSCSVLSP